MSDPNPQPLAAVVPRRDDDDERPRYTLADVLAIIPKTKRSQVELLVRDRRIAPAWPSAGTGHDRAFDGRNLFEIAIASELMALGVVGERLNLPYVLRIVLDPDAPANATYLVLLPQTGGDPWPVPSLQPRGLLEAFVSVYPAVYVLNVREIFRQLETAIEAFNQREGRAS